MVKFHIPGEFVSYREVPLNLLDPSHDCPEIILDTKDELKVSDILRKVGIPTDEDGFTEVNHLKRKPEFPPPPKGQKAEICVSPEVKLCSQRICSWNSNKSQHNRIHYN